MPPRSGLHPAKLPSWRWLGWLAAWACALMLALSPALEAPDATGQPAAVAGSLGEPFTQESSHTQAVALEVERDASEREFALAVPALALALLPVGLPSEIALGWPQLGLPPPHRPPRSLA